jgi:hypothetical protein
MKPGSFVNSRGVRGSSNVHNPDPAALDVSVGTSQAKSTPCASGPSFESRMRANESPGGACRFRPDPVYVGLGGLTAADVSGLKPTGAVELDGGGAAEAFAPDDAIPNGV